MKSNQSYSACLTIITFTTTTLFIGPIFTKPNESIQSVENERGFLILLLKQIKSRKYDQFKNAWHLRAHKMGY
jgi:hypothetical protein